ncbi:MAG: heparinase II/III domain-containing protein [Armatimonadota bacterium]
MQYAVAVFALFGVSALPPHPRLLFNEDGIARLRRRIETCEWAKTSWIARKKRIDELLGKQVELPPRGGNWYHWYACPKHSSRLVTGKRIGQWQWEHICPVDNEVFVGDPDDPSRDYDGCAISDVHTQWSRAIRDLGVAYQVTGDLRYANKAREILLAYAGVYNSYPLHTVRGEAKVGGGKVGAQSLDESVWLIPVCQGADLIWNVLSEDDRRLIAENLFISAVKEVILPHKLGIHNIQCWKNSAVGLVGFLLGDEELIESAINDPEQGYWAQLAKGVTADGQWWEGAWGYHFYTMWALWPLTEAARNCGINLYGPELRRMFDAPIKFAMPNLRLPAFNDSRESDLKASRGIYELGYARYADPNYLELLHVGERDSDYALWFGEPILPSPSSQARRSANYPASGYAILVRGEGEDASWLCLKYGPHGGGHGHPDKLSFVLYARGEVVAVDPGTAYYGLPIQADWFRTSLAHNTLVINETSQNPTEGKLISFGSSDGADYVVVDAGPVYEGVRFVRTVVILSRDLIIVADQILADRPCTIDIAYHQRGEWVELLEGEPWVPSNVAGYKCLEKSTVRDVAGQVTFATRFKKNCVSAVKVDVDGPAKLITALGIASDTQDRIPCAIVRRVDKEFAVVWAIALDGRPPVLERLYSARLLEESDLPPLAVRVTTSDGTKWIIRAGAGVPVKYF